MVRFAVLAALAAPLLLASPASAQADPVDFRSLRALLPAEAAGLTRQSVEGSRNSAMGFSIALATGEYAGAETAGGDQPTLTLKIVDFGGGNVPATMAAAWTMMEMDSETETGYERTVRVDGHPGFERYDTDGPSGSFEVVVAGRFHVSAEGYGVSEDQLRSALRAVDLAALAALPGAAAD